MSSRAEDTGELLEVVNMLVLGEVARKRRPVGCPQKVPLTEKAGHSVRGWRYEEEAVRFCPKKAQLGSAGSQTGRETPGEGEANARRS